MTHIPAPCRSTGRPRPHPPCARALPAILPAALPAALAVLLAGCAPAFNSQAVARLLEPEPIRITATGPPSARPGSCWGREQTPAVIETETRQTVLQPPPPNGAGSLREPPIYRTETSQRIVRERRELWFETLCDDRLTEDFTASLQRALAARKIHTGPITGQMDPATRHAIRRYQRAQGLDSGLLSLAAARQLGLVEVDLGPLPRD
jgi:hypothetical protein